MVFHRPGACIAALLMFVVSMAGCSKTPEAASPEFSILRDVDGMIRMANGKKITKPQELTQFENSFPLGAKSVKSGDVIVLWGVKMANEDGSGVTGELVAYEKKVPTEGGYVLLQDGNVKKMSAAEFEAAPKPKP